MRKLLLVCFFLGYSLCGSTQGIEFKETNFDKVLEIAKKEGKMIFLDVYTVWCGPCKMMAKDIFPLQEVGEFYNTHFISMKVDAEKKENIFIKKYNVNSFPTYLFLDENGELIYRALGHMEAKDFINVGQRALTEMKCKDNYSYLLEQYSIEWRKPHFLRNFLQVSLDRGFYLADLMKRYWTSQKIGVINSCGVGEILKEGKTISMDVDSFMADVNARNRKAEENVPEFFKKYPAEPITSKTDFCVGISNMVAEGLLKEMSEQIIFQVKEYALQMKSRELFDYALKLWEQLSGAQQMDERDVMELEFLQATDNRKDYLKRANQFLDRIMGTLSRERLLEKGNEEIAVFEKYGIADDWKERIREMYCDQYFNYVESIGRQCMQFSKNKKKLYPELIRWAEYAMQLKPNGERAKNFQKDIQIWGGKK